MLSISYEKKKRISLDSWCKLSAHERPVVKYALIALRYIVTSNVALLLVIADVRDRELNGEVSHTVDKGFMAIVRNSIFASMQDVPTRKAASSLRLAPVKNDVFLNALLETPMAKQERRSPLQWVGAMGLHIAIPAALIIVPLYTTGTINLGEHEEIPLVAPPPPPPAPPAGAAVAPHVVHTRARMTYTLQKLRRQRRFQKRFSGNAATPPSDLSAVAGGVPGGVAGLTNRWSDWRCYRRNERRRGR